MKKIIMIVILVIVLLAFLIITPNIVYAYKLDQSVRSHLGELETSDYLENENVEETNIKYGEDLVFTVVEEKGYDNGEWYSYHIVANYDKEYSEWTIKDKEAYENAWKEFSRLADAKNEELKQREEDNMQKAMNDLALQAESYSKEVVFSWITSYAEPVPEEQFENWKYNSYTKLYNVSGQGDRYADLLDEQYNMTASNFRNIVYPELRTKMKAYENYPGFEELAEQRLSDLEWLYHLSD